MSIVSYLSDTRCVVRLASYIPLLSVIAVMGSVFIGGKILPKMDLINVAELIPSARAKDSAASVDRTTRFSFVELKSIGQHLLVLSVRKTMKAP